MQARQSGFPVLLQIMTIFLKRLSLLAVLSIALSAGTLGAWAAQSAWACSSSTHCYAISEEDGTTNNGGVSGYLYIHCLYYPDTSAEANTEIWDGNGTYWVEDGVKSGFDYYGNYKDRDWFYAASSPNTGYIEHYSTSWNPANTDTNYGDLMEYVGGNDWKVFGGNTDFLMGTVTEQPPMSNRYMNAGTEYTASTASSGIRDIGNVNGQEYQDSGGTWHFISTGGYNASSSNNWFSASYNSSSSTMNWTGPC